MKIALSRVTGHTCISTTQRQALYHIRTSMGNTLRHRNSEIPAMSGSLPGRVIPALLLCLLPACSPRIEVAPPTEPITINLNVKIDHEVRVKVERDLEQVLSPGSELF